MHPELTSIVARLRYDELSGATHHVTDVAPRRGLFRRRRDMHHSRVTGPAPIVLLPPPREGRDTTGQRVA